MRSVVLPIVTVCGLVLLSGCAAKSKMVVSDSGGKSTITLDNNKFVAESTDDKGQKSSVDLTGSAHISLHDGDGNGLSFDADKGGVSFKAKGDEGETSMETGKSVSEADLGFPYYPGSVEVTTSSLTFDSREKKGVVSCRQTDDEPSKVIAYYKSMIQDTSLSTTVDNSGEHQELKGKNSAGAEVGVSANRDKGDTKTTVSVAVVTTKLASK